MWVESSRAVGRDNGGGVWTLTPAELVGLTLTPAADSDADFTLTVTATTTEEIGRASGRERDEIAVAVGAVDEETTLGVSDGGGTEDAPIAVANEGWLKDTV